MPANAEIQAVVFDLDDTLYAERDYVAGGYRAVADHLSRTRRTDEQFEQWLWQRFESGRSAGAFDALNEHFHLDLTQDQIGELVTVYREHPPAIRPAEGAAEFLSGLRGQFRLGLLTDGFLPAQQLKLEALGIAELFDAVVFTEKLGRESWKPSPAGFEEVVRKLGVPHTACVYVADNPAKDFVAPNKLGWLTIQLRRAGQIHAHKPAPQGGQASETATSWDRIAAILRS